VAADGTIAAVVLAAGASTRFGAENKLLADIDGRPLIRKVAEELLTGGIGNVVVVTGCDAELVARTLEALPVRVVYNANWQAGMGTSISAGLAALDSAPAGAFIVPGDMALLSAQLITELIGAFAITGQDRIVYPVTAEGAQRNPVLWPQRYFAQLRALSGTEGAKRILLGALADCVPVSTEFVADLQDVDTTAELEAMRAALQFRAVHGR
jgi:molybdenum cofactor cytidylyltransferase